ncbi:sugar ABC transporter ATP-binding protein [Marispirochaeta sp.]|uniref:sugar ABC transporter ATP-binding protein n=1 Tax=Marispirochaeta sp. TaxID=2038653 RepID=UPI0029C9470D|nr:sugar ABC transporter ATP-binding protein [Marispirochaeta sp.]
MMKQEGKIILTMSGVEKSFPGIKALDDVSIEVERGSVHGIVGENGAGKSTLMKILSGVYAKDKGTIIFDGETIESTTPHEAMERGLSIIYQELNLVNTMTVGENIFLGRFAEVGGMKGTHQKAREVLDRIGSKIGTWSYVQNLSVSHKQMVEIAKALSFNSKLIIMDEPSSSLTHDEMRELVEIIHQLKSQGISVIYISHKLDEIFEFCDMVTVMRDGQVVGTNAVKDFTRREMVSMMVGRSIENEFPERPRTAEGPLMEVKGLRTRKLHDISFTLKKGEILGLVGLVGAGRTEIVRALFGADKIKAGTIAINGEQVPIRNPRDAMKHGICLVPEDRKQQGLILPFSVENNISIACLKELYRFGILDKIKERQIAQKYIKKLRIKTPTTRTAVESLSGGNQQKCIIGRWLELSPRILIMDEPTKGIDVGAKYEIYLLMKQIVESGGSIILISSELPEVINMSNRVLTVCEGQITGEFDPEKTSVNEIMDKALDFAEEQGAMA